MGETDGTRSMYELMKGLFLHDVNQFYSMQDQNGAYHPRAEAGSYLHLTRDMVERHLRGEVTIAIQPVQGGTNLVKFGVIDVDAESAEEEALKIALAQVTSIKQAAAAIGVPSYIEFSGRRGWHLWIFPSKPVPAPFMRQVLRGLGALVGQKTEEIFPAGDYVASDYYPNPIKLPLGQHRQGGRSGFIGSDIAWEGGRPLLPDQSLLLSWVETVPLENLIQASLYAPQVTRKGTSQEKGDIEWEVLGNNDPPCIETLVKGVPASLEYNKANMTLARYVLSRGLPEGTLWSLGEKMAKATKNHPTSKDEAARKENLRSAYEAMVKRKERYIWACSYVWANQDLRRACHTCPLSKAEVPSAPGSFKAVAADTVAEAEVLRYILSEPSAIEEALETLVAPHSFLSTEIVQGKAEYLHEAIFRAMVKAYNDGALGVSTIISQLPDNLGEAANELLTRLLEREPVSSAVFRQSLSRLRENGLRFATAELVKSAGMAVSDRANPLEGVLERLSHDSISYLGLLTGQGMTSMSEELAELVADLEEESNVVATPSRWLNGILNGGFRPGRFYGIFAPPGAGKSTFCRWLADYAAANGTPVDYLSFEMGKDQIFAYSLAEIAGVDSRLIEARRWKDPHLERRDRLEEMIVSAVERYHSTIAPRMFIREGDEKVTPAVIRGHIKHIRADLGLSDNTPVLVVIDSIQHLQTGLEKLDFGQNETAKESRVAAALRRVARETKSVILGIAEMTKEAYKKATETGKMDLAGLRGSFRWIYLLDSVFVLNAGLVTVKRADRSAVRMDQWELYESWAGENDVVRKAMTEVRANYPLNQRNKARRVSLTFLKNRGSVLGTVLLVYEKATHRFIPVEHPVLERLEVIDE